MLKQSIAGLLACLTGMGACQAASQCYGTPAHGRIARAVPLPMSGANFAAYSLIPVAAGRNYVHSTVADIVLDMYAALEAASPGTLFVYGEAGLAGGGPFTPHKTHQNGLSLDFFVPVRNGAGKAVALPSSVLNHFGYDIEFDAQGRFGDYSIDFGALAEQLYQLQLAARSHRVTLDNVIIDTHYLPKLFATQHGPYLKANIPFMMRKPWIRHDEHFHVDFGLACKPFTR